MNSNKKFGSWSQLVDAVYILNDEFFKNSLVSRAKRTGPKSISEDKQVQIIASAVSNQQYSTVKFAGKSYVGG